MGLCFVCSDASHFASNTTSLILVYILPKWVSTHTSVSVLSSEFSEQRTEIELNSNQSMMVFAESGHRLWRCLLQPSMIARTSCRLDQ